MKKGLIIGLLLLDHCINAS